ARSRHAHARMQTREQADEGAGQDSSDNFFHRQFASPLMPLSFRALRLCSGQAPSRNPAASFTSNFAGCLEPLDFAQGKTFARHDEVIHEMDDSNHIILNSRLEVTLRLPNKIGSLTS